MFLESLDKMATLYLFHPIARLAKRDRCVRIPILMYHSISDDFPNRMHPYYWTGTSVRAFSCQMQFLRNTGYSVLSLRDALLRIGSGCGTETKQVVITFDDGFLDFYTEAFPILAKHGFVASVFLPTAYIGNHAQSFKGKQCLNWRQVRELHRAGISFGSHTVSHLKLRELGRAAQSFEIVSSKTVLEQNLGTAIDSFSFPYAFPEQDRPFVRQIRQILQQAGFSHGVSTSLGVASRSDDQFFLKRLPISSRDDDEFLQAKLDGAYNWLHGIQYVARVLKSEGIRDQ